MVIGTGEPNSSGGQAAAFGAGLLQLPEAWEREFGASFLSVQKAALGAAVGPRTPSGLRRRQPRAQRPRPAFTHRVWNWERASMVLKARLLHSELISYSFRRLESGNLKLVPCRLGSRGPKDPSLHSHGVWNWQTHGFGGPAAVFGASLSQLPED